MPTNQKQKSEEWTEKWFFISMNNHNGSATLRDLSSQNACFCQIQFADCNQVVLH